MLDRTEMELTSVEAQVSVLEAEKMETNAKIEDLEREMRRRETGKQILFLLFIFLVVVSLLTL